MLYGCNKNTRKDLAELPPAPSDMVLGFKLHRAYPVRSEGRIITRVSSNKESVYFHLDRKCIAIEFPHRKLTKADIVVKNDVAPPKESHKLKIREEFNLILD
uniref:Uncharacterized protein n=1 Tax=Clytia hemisphaerica TaxID=252671 RepID=A0A7M5X6Y7_9CNID